MSGIWSDVRYATRRLGKSPGFTAAAVLTLALGIGLNAGSFSVLNGALLRDLPVPGADELVAARQNVDAPGRNEKGTLNPRFTTAEFEAYRERSETLAGLMGYSLPWPASLGGPAAQEITGRYVTCGYFEVLRQPPFAGRALTADDCAQGAPPVVVLSHAFWSRAYAADPSIVGRRITMNGQPFEVIGIAAVDAYEPGLQRLDYYVPISAQPVLRPDRRWLISAESGWLELIGRRRAGNSLARVQAELDVIAADIDRAEPGRRTELVVERAKPTSLRRLGGSLLSGALAVPIFGLVLLIACANVANLFLAQALKRAPEIAVRRALGASRRRVVRQLLTEAVLIAGMGGVAGSVLAVLSFDVLLTILLSKTPAVPPTIALDLHVLSFALALSLGAGVLCGLAPALRASRADFQPAARLAAPGAGLHGSGRLRGTLIGAQVAACTVLLIAAGLLLRGLHATHTVDPGFPYRSVAYVSFDLRGFGYDAQGIAAFQRRLAADVRALPGVAAVGFAADPPLGGSNMLVDVRHPGADDTARIVAERNMVTPEFFSAAGIPLVLGRTFTEAEEQETSAVVIVTETTANNLWPNQNPLGRTLARGTGPQSTRWEVIGVARDAHFSVVGQTEPYYVFEPIPPQFRHQLKLIVRSATDVASIAPALRNAVQELDPRLVIDVVPAAASLESWQQRSALVTTLSLVIGALAMALAAVGIHGVVAFVVAQRTREIGVRMALGAPRGRVLSLILAGTMRAVAAGAVAGVLLGAVSSRLLSSVLFGISPLDPIAIAGAVVFLLGVALLASLTAARRALHVDAMTTIRCE